MKPFRILSIIVFSLILTNAYCDIIPADSHFVNKCVKITNAGEYDNVTMLAYILYVGSSHEDTYEVYPDRCLVKGYKFNTLKLFCISSNYIEGKDIDHIDLPDDDNALETNIEVNPYAGYWHNSIPIDEIEEYYEIIGFTDSYVVIHKWKEVFGFNDGSSDSIITYEYDQDTSLLYQSMSKALTINRQRIAETLVYPNSSDRLITAEFSNSFLGQIKLQLITLNGQVASTKVVLKESESLKTDISTSGIATGIYCLRIEIGDAIETKKILIK